MTMAPGVVIEARWMSSISLSRASAQRVARSSASEPPSASRLARLGAEPQQQAAFGGRRAGDPGADGVDEVKLDQFARIRHGRAAGDVLAEPFERGHFMAAA